ncbi:hypothetical protein AB205_0141990, partial [Aquarana catesbeiana]
DAQIYEELFNFACPKFLSPVVPNYDNVHPNYHKEPYLQQLKVFLDEVQQQAQLSTIRSFLKLYTTMPVAKLAGFLDLPEQEFRIQLLVFKHKMKNLVWTSGISALEGEFQSASEVDFYIDKGYKLFNRFPNSRCSFTVAEWHGYTSEEAYTFLSMTDESEEELAHLSDSGSEYKPIDSSGTLTDGSDDGVVVPAKEEIITALLFPDGAVAQLPDLNAVSGVHERHFPPCYPYPKKSPKKMSCLQKMRI